jgi:ATP-binding cassette subfamily B protein
MDEEAALATLDRRRSLRPLGRLVPYVMQYRGMVVGAGVFLVLAALTTLALPLAIRRIIDHGFEQSDSTFVGNYYATMVAIVVLLAGASACRYFFVTVLGERVIADLRRDVFAHVTTLSADFFDTAKSGEIVSRLAADTVQVKSAIGSSVSVALRNSIMGLGAMVMMIVTSPKLSALVVVAIPVVVSILYAFGLSIRAKARAAQDRLADATAYASEQIAAIRTLQAFTNEKGVNAHFTDSVEFAYHAARVQTKARAWLTFVAIFMVSTSVVAVLWAGSRDVLAGTMTPGTLSQFLIYAVIAGSSVGSLADVWGELSQATGAAERISELLSEKPTIAAPPSPRPMPEPAIGSVALVDVSFAYPGAPNRQVLDRLSVSARPGETVAIVGPSGAGKSTIFSLILRYYDPSGGTVLVDGIDVRRADPQKVRGRIAVVSQEVDVFAASIRENIAFGRPDATDAQIEAAAKDALADEFIRKLPQGYATLVGERGITLSGGQRQRIAIARAILRDAPILLLDEATSALDAESETLVQQALERLMRGRTTLVIAHRLATVLKADRIMVVDRGRVIEEGTHEELVRHGGVYAGLARLQFETGATAFRRAAE